MNKTVQTIVLMLFVPLLLIAEDIPITLEHAVTHQQRSKGLMGRQYLPPDHGMTFNYPMAYPLSFWMYNTLIDLSIAFLDQDKIIREIHELKAYPTLHDPQFFHDRGVTASFNAKYALEMNKGWFQEHHVKPGDQVMWNVNSPEGMIIKQSR